ncbi:thiol:disulfide interchange protein DsbA/DsbL [Litoribacillus peritrichatus]|uniref:Thiol:disulfide interchange protein n=1 Tax=Litoribacillus peritrichatus TaxID=718191 RepID=A0ABP7NE96_9GAMM
MKKLMVSLVATFAMLLSQLSVAENFVAGKDYQQLPYPVATRDENKIEVIELFWYGCGHCFKFEPMINRWMTTVAEDVDFHHQPGDFGGWAPETQLHYAMEAANVLEKGRAAVFNEYHVLRNKLRSEDKRIAFFKTLGVSEEDYKKAWNSFAVKSKVNMAQSRTRSYRVTGVPAMIVNGKYRVDSRSAGSFDRMLKVVDHLIELERTAKK